MLRQISQGLANAVGVLRPQMRLHRQGNDRDVGVGKHLPQRNPGTVVQAALGVLLHGKAVGLQGCHHLLRGFRAAGGGVAQFVQARIEAAKVVNGFQLRRCADRRHRSFPMGAHHHNGARCAVRVHQLAHGRARSTGLQGKSGRAVGHKENVAVGLHGVYLVTG